MAAVWGTRFQARSAMKKASRFLLPAALITVSVAIGVTDSLEARPQYRTAYRQVYPEDSRGGTLKCALCHLPKDEDGSRPDLKRRTSYGRQLEEALGEKNVKDRDRIREALREIGPFPGKDDDDD
jgi:hypothetical protein